MRACVALVAGFAAVTLLFPALGQETAPKQDEPKTVEKMEKKKIARVSEDVVMQSTIFRAKIKEVREAEKEIVVYPIDPQKQQAFLQWDQTTQAGILRAKVYDPARVERYKKDSVKKYDGIFAGEQRTIGVPETARVRTMFVPQQLDAKGNPKKTVDLARLQGNSRLPGYVSNSGVLRAGQIVDIYTPKTKKAAAPAKGTQIGATQTDEPTVGRVDSLLVVVVQDASVANLPPR